MATVNQVELHICGVLTQFLRVRLRNTWRIEFVLASGDMQYRSADWLNWLVFPVAGQPAADRDDASDGILTGSCESLVQCYCLREPNQHTTILRNSKFTAHVL
jgi:hypothetical protein